MKRKPDRYLNGLFKTPYDLKLTPIFVISLLNVAMAVGALLKIEITRRLLQAVFSSDGRALLRGFFFLAVIELIYSGMVHLNDYQYAKTEGDIYRQLLDKVLDKNERLRSLSNCTMGANDRFSMASEDCGEGIHSGSI